MVWTIEYDAAAQKQLRKLGRVESKRIILAIEAIAQLDDPRDRGIAMVGDYAGFWRFRMGDWRVIARLDDHRIVITVVEVGHRREIYR